MTRKTSTMRIAWLLLPVLCAAAGAKDRYPEPVHAPVLLYFCPSAAAPQLDGSLDDACWRTAPVITDFRCIHIGEGPAKKQTFAQMVYDDKAIYLAFRAIEPEIKKLKIIRGRDSAIYSGDCVEIYLQPDLNKVTRYQLVANVAGERWDAWIAGAPRRDKSDIFWGGDAKWRAVGRVGENEWTLEVCLPYADFGIVPGRAFAANLVRLTWTRGKEFSAWANTTYEQKDFRYWSFFVFGGPGVDEMRMARSLVPDYEKRVISWPTAQGMVLLDHGQRKEVRNLRADMAELKDLDVVIQRVVDGEERLGRRVRLRDLPRRLKAVQRQRAALALRIQSESLTAVGLAQLRDQIAQVAKVGRDLEWNLRALDLLGLSAAPNRR